MNHLKVLESKILVNLRYSSNYPNDIMRLRGRFYHVGTHPVSNMFIYENRILSAQPRFGGIMMYIHGFKVKEKALLSISSCKKMYH